MILEVAEVHVTDGAQEAFEEAVAETMRRYVSTTDGYVDHELRRSVETPTRYLLLITWESIEAHMDNFRNGPDFEAHRALISPHFARPPVVEHFTVA